MTGHPVPPLLTVKGLGKSFEQVFGQARLLQDGAHEREEGDREQELVADDAEHPVRQIGHELGLEQAGVKTVYFESPGTKHEWHTWRRSLHDFAPRLFQPVTVATAPAPGAAASDARTKVSIKPMGIAAAAARRGGR